MPLRYLCVCLLFLLCALPARAASLAERLQQKYATINAMQADFTQTLLHKESGSTEKRSGTLLFKKPLLVRWETQKPSPELLIVGSNAIWNVFPNEELVYKYSPELAQDSRSIVRVVTGQTRLDQNFFVEEEGKDGSLVKLRLYPKEPTQSLVEALLWVDPEADLIKKLRVYDFYGNENEISFSSQNIAATAKDADFSYKAPKGFVVEDRTKQTDGKPQKPLMQ